VSILSEALRHENGTYSQKREDADDENGGQPKQVPCILEGIHKSAVSQLHRSAHTPLCAGSQTDVFIATRGSDLRKSIRPSTAEK